MNVKHWTEEELVAHLYGVGPDDGHSAGCATCRAKLAQMRQRKSEIRESQEADGSVSFEFLASQRRRIYQRLYQSPGPTRLRRFVPALAASLVVAGVLLFVDQEANQKSSTVAVRASDTQLVEDVGRVAFNSEPAPVAPIQALFEQ